jgi:hypothetical protein
MKSLRILMPDRSKWDVPLEVIARHRAAYYSNEFDGDVGRSLAEDTWPLFNGADGDYEAHDWASNNMNWSDVAEHAREAVKPPPMDTEEGWCNGEWEVVDA